MEASTLTHAQRRGLFARRSPLLRFQDDEQLVALTRKGHQHAFDALVERYQSRLLGFCRQMLGSTEDAEDVLQEVFVAAYNAMVADERPIAVRPWLYRIARNRCLNHLRKPTADGQDTMDTHPHMNGVTTLERVQNREEFRNLLSDVGKLPETQRSALLLREIDAMSYEEIAQAMDTTVPGVKSLLVRARIALAESSQARQLTCDDVRLELAEAAEGIAKVSGPVRRHMKALRPLPRVPLPASLRHQGPRRDLPGRAAAPPQGRAARQAQRPVRWWRRRRGRRCGRRRWRAAGAGAGAGAGAPAQVPVQPARVPGLPEQERPEPVPPRRAAPPRLAEQPPPAEQRPVAERPPQPAARPPRSAPRPPPGSRPRRSSPAARPRSRTSPTTTLQARPAKTKVINRGKAAKIDIPPKADATAQDAAAAQTPPAAAQAGHHAARHGHRPAAADRPGRDDGRSRPVAPSAATDRQAQAPQERRGEQRPTALLAGSVRPGDHRRRARDLRR